MKKYKTKLLLPILILFLYSLPIFASNEIVSAIKAAEDEVTDSISQSNSLLEAIQLQMKSQYDDSFKGEFDTNGKLKGQSTLDRKIDLYVRSFYAWFTKKFFDSFPGIDFSEKRKENEQSIKSILAQTIGYTIIKNFQEKQEDQKALLAQQIEGGAMSLSIPSSGSPYGPLKNETPKIEKLPTVIDLLGPDSYTENEQDKAKLFINYILNSSPIPETIFIPNDKGKKKSVSIRLPKAKDGAAYTNITISTTGINSEFDRMKKYLSINTKSKLYREYKMKIRSDNVLRTIYLDSLLRPYQERVKDLDDKNAKSLIEKERNAAISGLDKKYYEELKDKSMADINLETIRAINKLSYFIYKLHEDNVRNSLSISMSGLKMISQQDIADKMRYIDPIITMIENRCWDVKQSDKDRKDLCNNPGTGALMDTEIELKTD